MGTQDRQCDTQACEQMRFENLMIACMLVPPAVLVAALLYLCWAFDQSLRVAR